MQTSSREFIVVLLSLLLAIAAIFASQTLLRERIEHTQRRIELQPLLEALPDSLRDRVELESIGQLDDAEQLGLRVPTPLYRMFAGNDNIGWLVPVTTRDGYGGDIELALALSTSGKILGVNVLHHRETAGVGDRIEKAHSDWLDKFVGRSLTDPRAGAWFVRKDNGEFDQITGATMTSRAVTRAVRQALEFVATHPEKFSGTASADNAEGKTVHE